MKILPLAFDSLGTRSMATYVETEDCKILIDPAVALAPKRSGLPPHIIEQKEMAREWDNVKKYANKADVLIVSHYHYDHHNPMEPEIYKGKTVFPKHPTENINKSQKTRSKRFIANLGILPKEIQYSDGNSFTFGKTKITFSDPVFHGLDNYYGFVIETLIDDGKEKFIHTSDCLGPCTDNQTKFILKNNPDFLISDGPMPFMLKEAKIRMKQIIEKTKVSTYVIDHHFLRDAKWKSKIEDISKLAEKKKIWFGCAAEYLGQEPNLLETKRKELYKGNPV